jgi:enoyl-CoA hydratase/carnithine racemase
MSEPVIVAVDGGVMTLTLNRPDKKNALTNAMYATLGESLARAESDASIRAILIQAEGDSFTAGNDLGDFAAVASGALKREDMKSGLFLAGLARAQKPIVAAVQGQAVGIGVTMLLHCDFAYVADDAKLSTPFVNLGLVPEAASSLLLPARVGYALAFRMFALGEPIDGKTAAQMGLVTASLPASEVRAAALATAKKLATKPAGALKAMKGLLRDPTLIQATMSKEGDIFGARLKSPETAEALRAFAEKRAPDFSKFS